MRWAECCQRLTMTSLCRCACGDSTGEWIRRENAARQHPHSLRTCVTCCWHSWSSSTVSRFHRESVGAVSYTNVRSAFHRVLAVLRPHSTRPASPVRNVPVTSIEKQKWSNTSKTRGPPGRRACQAYQVSADEDDCVTLYVKLDAECDQQVTVVGRLLTTPGHIHRHQCCQPQIGECRLSFTVGDGGRVAIEIAMFQFVSERQSAECRTIVKLQPSRGKNSTNSPLKLLKLLDPCSPNFLHNVAESSPCDLIKAA